MVGLFSGDNKMSNTNNETTVTTTASQTIAVQTPVKRGRGRPKGSKNKPKVAKTTAV